MRAIIGINAFHGDSSACLIQDNKLIVATEEEDVIFLALKDLSHSIIGMAVDGTMSGPHYEPGFKPVSSTSQV